MWSLAVFVLGLLGSAMAIVRIPPMNRFMKMNNVNQAGPAARQAPYGGYGPQRAFMGGRGGMGPGMGGRGMMGGPQFQAGGMMGGGMGGGPGGGMGGGPGGMMGGGGGGGPF